LRAAVRRVANASGSRAVTVDAPQRVAVPSDEAAIRELMRASAIDLFPRFYDERQVASGALYIARLGLE